MTITAKGLRITNPAPGPLTGHLASIDGTAGPSAVVYISIDGGDDTSVTAGPDGHWSQPVGVQPPAGSHTVRAQSATASVTVTFSVPASRSFEAPRQLPRPLPQPIGPAGVNPAPSAIVLAITTPVDGSTPDTVKVIRGTAPPGSVVTLTIDGTDRISPMSVTAGADGLWSISSTAGLSPGAHSIVASAGGASVTVSVTIPQAPVSPGIPDVVWLGGAAAVVAWWIWRMFKRTPTPQVEAPRNNPAEPPSLKLQTIIVSKERASSKSEAREIAQRFARTSPLPAADETGRSFRFRQREPRDFVPGSFRTIQPTDGVSLVLGHLR